MKWGVLGCGVIGERRSAQLPKGVQVTACYDVNQDRAATLAKKLGAQPKNSLEAFLSEPLDGVIIAPINSELLNLSQACLDKGMNILVEKPAARSFSELKKLKNPKGKIIKIGFNHRFHPAFERLRQEIASQPHDPIMFIK